MDFGAFFLFGGACIYCTFDIVLAVLALKKTSRVRARKRLLIATLPTIILGWWIYHAYYLDEGLVVACMHQDAAAAKALLLKGANPNARWENGEHALSFAGNDSSILKLLIDKGADVNAQDSRGITALQNAKAQRYPHAVTILQRAGAKD